MILPNKLYDILKWVALLFLPTFGKVYDEIADIWGLPYADEISRTVTAVCVLLGALLGVSNVRYYMAQSLEMPADEVEVDNSKPEEM